ncbi:MAG: hypothetical protein ACOX6N_05150 [Patescibacteria group bacterium]|jgi:hypothetical protein
MITNTDRERLEAAQQAVDLAQQALTEIYKAENVLLAELAYEHMENLGKINQKLRRLLTITTANN